MIGNPCSLANRFQLSLYTSYTKRYNWVRRGRFLLRKHRSNHVFLTDLPSCRSLLPLYPSFRIDKHMPLYPGREVLAIPRRMGSTE